jgi:hypothetical protein
MMDATWSYPTTISSLMAQPSYFSISVADLIQHDVCIPGRFMDLSAFRYRDSKSTPTRSVGVESTVGWAAIIVVVEGAPQKVEVVRLEAIHHYEGLTRTETTLLEETPAELFSPAALAATKNMVELLPVSSNRTASGEVSNNFWTKCQSAFNQGLQIAHGVASNVSTVAKVLATVL